MIRFTEIPYNIEIPLHTTAYSMPVLYDMKKEVYPEDVCLDYQLMTCIVKTRDVDVDKYDIRLIRLSKGNRKPLVVGNMYFSCDLDKKESYFYGVMVRSSYRNKGISNYLISRWIEICLQNGIENLYTIRKQRKPILLYSLKKLSFELEDQSLYNQGHNIIVCKDNTTGEKVFYFEDKLDEEVFISSAIYMRTPHKIIPEISSGYSVLDRIILSEPYIAQDLVVANKSSEEIIESFPNRISKR